MPLFANGTGTITVTDSNGGTAEVTVSITITGIVEAPDVSAMSADVQENDMSGPNLLEVSSPDTGVTFSVDNDKFEIDTVGSASVLKLKDGMYLDHEGTDGMVTLMITATDGMGNASMSTEVTINVGDVNEAPMISVMDSETPDGMTAAASIMENAAGVPVGEIMVSDYDMADADLSDMITVSDDRFEVSKDNEGGLWLKLKDGVSLDHETDPMVTVTVGVTDTGTNGMAMSASTDVVVTVGNVNEGPTISVVDSMTPEGDPARSNIPENQAGVPVGEIMISDPDMADAELGEDDITLSGEHAMYFELDTDDMGGIWLKLKDGVSLNYEEMSSVMVTVTVTDSGMASAMDTVTVTVGNVNEPPSISVDNPMIAENTTGSVGIVTVTDNEEMRDITLDVEDIRVVGRDDFEVVESKSGDYELRLTKPIDFESDAVMKDDDFTGYVEVVLEVTDEGLNGSDPITTTQPIRVMVVNEDEAPMISVEDDGDAVSSIAENSNADAEVVVGRIDASDPENGDFDMEGVMLSGADAESFYVRPDDEDVLWLVLKEGVSADHEGDNGSLNVTLTVSDGTNAPAMTDFTLTLMDVNEAPVGDNDKLMKLVDHDEKDDTPDQAQMLEMYEPAAVLDEDNEDPFSIKLDLTNAFDDEDGDTLFTYSMTVTGPDGTAVKWLNLGNPERGDDGSIVVTVSGVVPAGSVGAHEVTIHAEDQSGMKGMVSFNLIVDDGNDEITDITLTNLDGTDNARFDVTVDENDESGMLFGYLNSVDLDDPRHPHGAHKMDDEKWTVSDKNFKIVEVNGKLELRLKDGMSLDFENPPEKVMIVVTDADGEEYSQELKIQINNKNDAPTVKTTQPGNWWVTVDEDLDADDVDKGEWLTFQIEVDGDPTPLFEDQDAGEKLTYELSGSGAAFLEINDMGVIQNKEGMIADRGVYDVTVTAKDDDGAETDPVTFKLAVVLSDEDDEDKAAPEIENANGMDFKEGSDAGAVVARFTVENPDLDMKGVHPWGAMTVKLTAAHNTSGNNDELLPDGEMDAYFKAEMESSDGDSEVWVVKVTEAGAKALNHEVFDDVRLTVKVWDEFGTGNSEASPDDERTINFDVTDRDEPIRYIPDIDVDHSTSGLILTDGMLSFTTMQQTDPTSDTVTLYLNLSKLFEDEDTDDDDDEMSFSISENTSWLTIKQRPMEWRDIEDANDDDNDPNNDVVWGGDSQNLEEPDARDIVAIIEINRDGVMGKDNDPAPGEIGQDDNGSFTISVTGQDSADRATATVTVKIMDENLDAAAGGVTISNTKPVQGNSLTMRFDESKDPDFTGPKAGMPIAELYMWKTAADADGNEETTKSVSINNPTPYDLTDAEVGMHIGGTVVYFELFDGNIVRSEEQDAKHTDAVENRNDAPKSTLAVMGTNGEGELVFTGDVTDADEIPDEGQPGAKAYKWQYSANGVSGWKDFADADTSTPMTTTIPANVVGNYVRLVVTFTDEGGMKERVEAQTMFKVGDLATTVNPNPDGAHPNPFPTPAISIERGEVSGEVKAGGQLKVNGTTPGAVIEWLIDGKVIQKGTGTTLEITQAHAGKSIMAKVTGMKDGNVTYITETIGQAVLVLGPTGGSGNSAPSKAKDMIVDVGAAEAEGTLFDAMAMIDFSTLFDDVEDGLTYNITGAPVAFNSDVLTDAGINVNEYRDDNAGSNTVNNMEVQNGDQLLLVDESDSKNVKFYYYSTKGMTHDDNDDDSQGNIVAVTVTATDAGAGGVTVHAMAGIRIDVPATGVVGAVSDDKPFDLAVSVEEDAKTTDDARVASVVINIHDENHSMGDDAHDYGSYDWENAVVSDARFEVVAVEGDKSAATFSLKKGATLDNVHEETMIPVTVTVKPLGAITDEITITVTVTVMNTDGSEPDGDETDPTNVPGLKDNEDGDDDDRLDGTDGDDDTEDDGGMAMMPAMVDDGLF